MRRGPGRTAQPILRLVHNAGHAADRPPLGTGHVAPVRGALALRLAPHPVHELPSLAAPAPHCRLRLVLIGVEPQGHRLRALPPGPRLHVDPEEITAEFLSRTAPETVAFPLVSRGFDAFDTMQRLARLDYAGQALVICPRLPVPEIVSRELSQAAPRIALSLLLESH